MRHVLGHAHPHGRDHRSVRLIPHAAETAGWYVSPALHSARHAVTLVRPSLVHTQRVRASFAHPVFGSVRLVLELCSEDLHKLCDLQSERGQLESSVSLLV